jgi:hypothetical protein
LSHIEVNKWQSVIDWENIVIVDAALSSIISSIIINVWNRCKLTDPHHQKTISYWYISDPSREDESGLISNRSRRDNKAGQKGIFLLFFSNTKEHNNRISHCEYLKRKKTVIHSSQWILVILVLFRYYFLLIYEFIVIDLHFN